MAILMMMFTFSLRVLLFPFVNVDGGALWDHNVTLAREKLYLTCQIDFIHDGIHGNSLNEVIFKN